jgi:hypothetical protein
MERFPPVQAASHSVERGNTAGAPCRGNRRETRPSEAAIRKETIVWFISDNSVPDRNIAEGRGPCETSFSTYAKVPSLVCRRWPWIGHSDSEGVQGRLRAFEGATLVGLPGRTSERHIIPHYISIVQQLGSVIKRSLSLCPSAACF